MAKSDIHVTLLLKILATGLLHFRDIMPTRSETVLSYSAMTAVEHSSHLLTLSSCLRTSEQTRWCNRKPLRDTWTKIRSQKFLMENSFTRNWYQCTLCRKDPYTVRILFMYLYYIGLSYVLQLMGLFNVRNSLYYMGLFYVPSLLGPSYVLLYPFYKQWV